MCQRAPPRAERSLRHHSAAQYPTDPYEIVLNGADGLERPTVFNCGHLYTIDRRKISATLGRVAPERRRQIGRKIVATYRLPL